MPNGPQGQYGGSERWQGTVIIENGDWYGKCRLPVVFSMERTRAPLELWVTPFSCLMTCNNRLPQPATTQSCQSFTIFWGIPFEAPLWFTYNFNLSKWLNWWQYQLLIKMLTLIYNDYISIIHGNTDFQLNFPNSSGYPNGNLASPNVPPLHVTHVCATTDGFKTHHTESVREVTWKPVMVSLNIHKWWLNQICSKAMQLDQRSSV